MHFRNDINGLRAIAVIVVVLFHFNVVGFDGGFVGVDVFFVISGYLMTAMIFPAVEESRFSLLKFYLGRVRRIVPALATVCMATLIAGWCLLFPEDFRRLAKHVVSALLFISNIIFARESGYFDSSPFDKWLLHTWSLSVEWQFYLLYPIAIMGLARVGVANLARRGVILAFIVSLALSIFCTLSLPTEAFYLLHTRAWELLAGAIVFLYPIAYGSLAPKSLELAGLALIGISTVGFSYKDAWPGYAAAVPVVGTMLVIWSRQTDSAFTSNPLSKLLGKASYSIYLWHWLVVVALHYLSVSTQPAWQLAGILASILLGWISYKAIENPTRKTQPDRRLSGMGHQFARTLIAPAAVLAIGGAVVVANGVPQQLRAINSGERVAFVEHYRLLHEKGLNQAYRSDCDFYDWTSKRGKESVASSCTEAGGTDAVFLWGDSHAQALSNGLRKLVGEAHVSQVATSGCPPDIDGLSRSKIQNNCLSSNRYALAEIGRLKPGVVILAQVNLHGSTDWDRLADKLHALGVARVILAGPQPAWQPALPLLVARNHWLDKEEFINDGLHGTTLANDAALRRKLAQTHKVEYVSMTDTVCRPTLGCRAFLPGTRELTVVDEGHLSPEGSIFVVDNAFKAILVPATSSTRFTTKNN